MMSILVTLSCFAFLVAILIALFEISIPVTSKFLYKLASVIPIHPLPHPISNTVYSDKLLKSF